MSFARLCLRNSRDEQGDGLDLRVPRARRIPLASDRMVCYLVLFLEMISFIDDLACL